MPLIIDANRASDFTEPLTNHAPEIVRKIGKGDVNVVVGGKLLIEISKTRLGSLLIEWDKAGRLKRVKDQVIESKN